MHLAIWVKAPTTGILLLQLAVQKSRTRIPSSCTFPAGKISILPSALMSHLSGPWPALMQEQIYRYPTRTMVLVAEGKGMVLGSESLNIGCLEPLG